jgi:hypothetical protein
MMTQFKAAMAKLQTLGQPKTLIDCSDVVPVPKPFTQAIKFPPTKSIKDVQIAVSCSFRIERGFTKLRLLLVPYQAIPKPSNPARPCYLSPSRVSFYSI